jgi:diaminopimelate decarboxylase
MNSCRSINTSNTSTGKKKRILSGTRSFFQTRLKRTTLAKIKQYKPLVTYDNNAELIKLKRHCDTAGLVLRLKVPDTGSQVEMASKFGAEPGDAQQLIQEAFDMGLKVEGSQLPRWEPMYANFDNYTVALDIASTILNDARKKGFPLNLVDIGGGFPSPLRRRRSAIRESGRSPELRAHEALPR